MNKKTENEVVLYIGTGGQKFTCPVCSKVMSKGFIRQRAGKTACSALCIDELSPKGS